MSDSEPTCGLDPSSCYWDCVRRHVCRDERAQLERFMADRERCMPSERARLEQAGFVAAKPLKENDNAEDA